jgi:hypothetical protein
LAGMVIFQFYYGFVLLYFNLARVVQKSLISFLAGKFFIPVGIQCKKTE